MRIAKLYLMILALSYCALACSMPKASDQVKPFPVGEYQYTGYDSKGTKIIAGLLSITSAEPKRINSVDTIELKGTWQLDKVGNPERIGPQVGSGDFYGSLVNGEVRIGLNPNMNDNNVNLAGKIENGRFSGEWSYSGFAGRLNQGTFEATKK